MDELLLKNKLDQIEEQVQELTSKTGHLKSPLDPFSRHLIEQAVPVPVTISLYNTQPQTAANFSTFFIAERGCLVLSVLESHGTAGTDVGTVSLQIERLQGTEALDAGDEILTSAINLKGTANTVVYPSIKSGVSTLSRGDRLALKDSGTLTALKDVTVTVYLKYL